jgi:hypothetical protein
MENTNFISKLHKYLMGKLIFYESKLYTSFNGKFDNEKEYNNETYKITSGKDLL